jgi:hypothetical protein
VNFAACIESVNTWKPHVKYDQIRLKTFTFFDSAFAGISLVEEESCRREQAGEHDGVDRIIIDEENPAALEFYRKREGHAKSVAGKK